MSQTLTKKSIFTFMITGSLLTLSYLLLPIQTSFVSSSQDKRENALFHMDPPKPQIRDRCTIEPNDPCRTIHGPKIRVPQDLPTIQGAVDRLASGGTIIIDEGTYKENVVIPDGRRIRLISAGREERTILLAVNPEEPVITASPGVTLCLKKLTLMGGRAGVEAGQVKEPSVVSTELSEKGSSPLQPASRVSLSNLSVAKAGNGVILNSQRAFLKKVTAIENDRWGIVSVSPETKVCDSNVSSNGLGGILVDVLAGLSLPCTTLPGTFFPVSGDVIGSDIIDNDGPGIVVCNADGFEISSNLLSSNRISNILIDQSTDIEISENDVVTAETDSGSWGDGVQVMDSSAADITDNTIWFNSRAGVYFNASGGSLISNSLAGNKFNCALEGGADPLVEDNSFTSIGDEGGSSCVVGQDLEPPPAVGAP